MPGRVLSWLLLVMFVFSLGAAAISARRRPDYAEAGPNRASIALMEQEAWKH